MFKLKYYSYLILLIILINFSNKSFSDNHNLNEIIKLMQKDLETLERAVYSENFSLNEESKDNLNNIDQNSDRYPAYRPGRSFASGANGQNF